MYIHVLFVRSEIINQLALLKPEIQISYVSAFFSHGLSGYTIYRRKRLYVMRSLCARAFEVVSDPELYFPSGVIGDPTLASYKKGTKK